MDHASHLLIGVIICIASLHHGNSAENPILTRNLLSNLASNVGTILTPTFLKEFEKNFQNRTAVNGTITTTPSASSTQTSLANATIPKIKSAKHQRSPGSMTTKKSRTTTVPTTILFPEEKNESYRGSNVNDNEESRLEPARAQQRQLENQYPFDFRNNFGSAFQNSERQLESGPLRFGGRDLLNPDGFQLFGVSSNGAQDSGVQGGLDGVRGTGGTGTSGIGSRFPLRPTGEGQNAEFIGLNRPFGDSNFDRFQDFGRFGFDGQFPDNRFLDPTFRSSALANRFNNFGGQSDPRNNFQQNGQNFRPDLPQNGNLLNPSISSELNTLNQRNRGATIDGRSPFLNPNFQAPYNQNLFGFPTQQFRDTLSDDLRNPQRELIYQTRPRDESAPNSVGSTNSQNSNSNNPRNNDDTTRTVISSRRSESDAATKPASNIPKIEADIPGVQSLQDRLDIENLFYPALDDYSDVRVNPDAFKQHLLASNIIEKHSKTNIV